MDADATEFKDSRARAGGLARAAGLDAESRSEIARRAAEARWGEVRVAYHTGDISIGDMQLSCAVLEDGTRLVNQSTILTALGRNPQKSRRHRGDSIEKRPPFLLANNLQPFITDELRAIMEPIRYRVADGGNSKPWGYRAEMLPLVCDVYLEAREANMLDAKQVAVARAAEILVRGLARVGIVALVDEATGYQEVRARDELQMLLEAYVQAELRPWLKTFPDEFFREVYRLQGWEYRPGTSKRPCYVGKLINKYVYEQLPPGVLDELRRLNPKNEKGYRARKHHQFLTVDTGNVHLDRQISTVTTLMRIAKEKQDFEELFERAFAPQQRLPLVVELPEGEDDSRRTI